jgi:N-acyl-D-aspartate/D-glutamate deacylase
MQADILFQNARLVDGAGTPWFRGDLAVREGAIVAMGNLPGMEAGQVIDARDRYLMPGFIDAHTHYDWVLLKKPAIFAELRQGVTTLAIGQCGYSGAPVSDDSIELYNKYVGFLRGGVTPDWTWRSFKEWLDHLDSLPLGQNVRSYVGHATIWMTALGFTYHRPDPDEMKKMVSMLERCMEEGACGMTSGLVYSPGMNCLHDEMTEVVRGLVPRRGVYETHMRSESSRMVECVKDSIAVGEANGIPVQIAHHKAAGPKNWGSIKESLRLVAEARERGVDVTFNQYPYDSASTTLRAILPVWVHEGGVDALCERLATKATRERIIKEVLETDCAWENFYEIVSGGPDGIVLLNFPNTPEVEGKTLSEAATMMHTTPVEAALDLILANRGEDASAYRFMCEEDTLYALRHPAGMVASDSIPAPEGSNGHPRGAGTFTRLLDHYVKQTGALTLEEAVRRITSAPARRLGIMDRGLLAPGLAADIVLLNMETLADNATYEHPQNSPDGIDMVMVNGKIAMENGQEQQTGAGRVLR